MLKMTLRAKNQGVREQNQGVRANSENGSVGCCIFAFGKQINLVNQKVIDMAKSMNIITGPIPTKYYFLKRDLVGNFINDNLFQDAKFLGVILIPTPNLNPVKFIMKKFSTNSNRDILTDTSYASKTAVIESAIAQSQVKGLDFCFMDKVQLQWLLEQMGPDDKLCFSDAYIDLGKTPPYINPGSKKYLTLKAWIEKSSPPTIAGGMRFIARSSSATFPDFSVLVPCPPIWPPYNKNEPHGFIKIGT
jgi:hypothetical protein